MLNARNLSALFAAVLLGACGPTASDYEDETPKDEVSDTDTNSESERNQLEWGLWGSVEVDPDNSYEGEEADYFWSLESNEYLCLYTYQASGSPTTGCDQCDFAFDVSLTDGATTEGSCTGDPFGYEAGQTFNYTMGFAAEFEDPDGNDHDDVWFYYYYSSDEGEGFWYYYIDGTDGDITYADGVLEFTITKAYYYY